MLIFAIFAPMNPFQKIARRLKAAVNDLFFREMRFKREVRRHLLPYYTDRAPAARNARKTVVAMYDGRRRHGGLADRLRSIATVYAYCRENGLDFRLHFTAPFRLEEYLLPNRYDWRIADDELCYNRRDARPVYIGAARGDFERDKRFQRKMVRKFLALPYKQLHVYTSMYYEEERFGELFDELFRPAPALQRAVDEATATLAGGGMFVSVSTRFRELLGDFRERRDRPAQGLPDAEQEALIARCCARIERIRAQHPEAASVLVTSDSARFLERAARLEGVRVLPGRIAHMDVADGSQAEVHAKTFLDFLVLSRAAELYLLVTGGMYAGNFAKRAAQLGGRPYHEVRF